MSLCKSQLPAKQWTASGPARRLTRAELSEDDIMAQASQLHALASRFIETESLPWIATAPGSKMKVIYHDPNTEMLTILAKLEPGAGIPPHVHEDLEQTFVLEGSLRDDEGECTAGNFVIRAKGSRHAPIAPNGCTMLVFFLKPTAALKKILLEHV
jgi:anti-sigma factor ChrR (cupin superfamily)